jgi:chemotaxis protein CheD
MLPDSSLGSGRGKDNPYVYADTGVVLLVERVLQLGASKHRLQVHLAGGAQVIDDAGIFNIGKRNHLSARKALWKAGLMVHEEMVGGSVFRSIRLEVETGKISVREGNGRLSPGTAPLRPGGGS